MNQLSYYVTKRLIVGSKDSSGTIIHTSYSTQSTVKILFYSIQNNSSTTKRNEAAAEWSGVGVELWTARSIKDKLNLSFHAAVNGYMF